MIQADCFEGVLLVQGNSLLCRATIIKHVMIDPNFTTHTCVPCAGRSRCCFWAGERGSTSRHVAAFHLSGLVTRLCSSGQSMLINHVLVNHMVVNHVLVNHVMVNPVVVNHAMVCPVLVNHALINHVMVNQVLIHVRPKVNSKSKSGSHSRLNVCPKTAVACHPYCSSAICKKTAMVGSFNTAHAKRKVQARCHVSASTSAS